MGCVISINGTKKSLEFHFTTTRRQFLYFATFFDVLEFKIFVMIWDLGTGENLLSHSQTCYDEVRTYVAGTS